MSKKYALVVQSRELARKDAPPFIPESRLLEGLWGIKVFLYDTQREASEGLRTFPSSEWNCSVVPVTTLSEALDNPYAFIWHGDSPDE